MNENSEFLETYGWAILAAIIAIGVLAYFGVFGPSRYVSGESFKIYKNECRKETQQARYRIEDFVQIDCPSTKEEAPCYDSKGSVILGLKCMRINKPYGDVLCFKLINDSDGSILMTVDSGARYSVYSFYRMNNLLYQWVMNSDSILFPEKPGMNETHEVCERKEVSEVKIADPEGTINGNCMRELYNYSKGCFDEPYDDGHLERCIEYYCHDVVYKEFKLSREWLDQNWQCIVHNDDKNQCQTWRYEDYEVTVVQ